MPSDKVVPPAPSPMDIYTEVGQKVRYSLPKNGYPHHQEKARRLLEFGGVYTLRSVEVQPFSTAIELAEIPGQSFNSVMFSNVEPAAPPQAAPPQHVPTWPSDSGNYEPNFPQSAAPVAPSLEEKWEAIRRMWPDAEFCGDISGGSRLWSRSKASYTQSGTLGVTSTRLSHGRYREECIEDAYAKLPAQPGDGPEEALRDAANDWYETTGFTLDHLDGLAQEAFKAGADWQASRSREDGWVSVAERLPDSVGPWLVSKGAGKVAPRRTCLTAMTTYGSGRLHFPPSVTHWQPLPTPPKEGGKA